MTIKIKRWAAIFMLLAFFLPLVQLTRCTTFRLPDGTTVDEEHIVDIYAYSDKWGLIERALLYTAFLWPLIFSVTSLIWPGLNQKSFINVLELLLCVGSGFILGLFMYFYLHDPKAHTRYGLYVAWGSIGLYFVTTSVELVARVRKKWVNKHNRMFQQTHAYGTRR